VRRIIAITSVGLAALASSIVAEPASAASVATSYCASVKFKQQTTNNQAMWCHVQYGVAYQGGYSGPVDGIPGVNTWKGTQTWLKRHYGYSGAIDGVPGPLTYSAMQRAGRNTGYTGPIDGIMGPNSWRAWASIAFQAYGD